MKTLRENLQPFSYKDVKIMNPYEVNAFELEIKYLLSIDEDRLLRGFCDIAGIESSSPLYGGWETSNIQGHTMGHYLTALSQAYAATEKPELLKKIERIVSVLSLCQNKTTGYLAAIPEEHYIKLEKGDASDTWVPWYSMHKIISGLISACKFAGSKKALDVASRLGDWVFSRTVYWDAETQKTVLNIEYGGMNDCLYELYALTKSKNHLAAAHCFDELPLFTALYRKEDILDGKHANTTIPKFLGALKRYKVLGEGEEFYLVAAANFWDIVTENHTYATGGNSEWEHFGKSRILDAERTECNCETCNTYNMLKLTRELFMLTGEKKYADYYESAFINAIISSQNPETGMTTYFQPMGTGFFKVYSSAYDHFWCCTGSGMENFSKLNDSIYFKGNDCLYIMRYTDSSVRLTDKNMTLKAEYNDGLIPTVRLTTEGAGQIKLMLRIPHWCTKSPIVTINGENVEAVIENGFIRLSHFFNADDEIICQFPTSVRIHRLPDNKNTVAFFYGQYLLSADLGRSNMNTGVTGVNVTIPLADSEKNESGEITVSCDIEAWLENIEENLSPCGDNLKFKLINADRDLIFTPHYCQHKSRYGIYFTLKQA